LKRLLSTAIAVALATSGALVLAPASTAGPQTASARPEPTAFALRTSGFGTRVTRGQLPVQSGTTAYQVIGCTNQAGLARENHQATAELPGLGTVSAVKTDVWTTQHQGTTSSWSRHTVGKVVLSDSPLGTLTVDAVRTTARAYHDAKGFHTAADTQIGSITFKPVAGPEQTVPIPAPGEPVEIPGFATITLGHSLAYKSASAARVFANGLKVDLTASGSVVQIAHAQAEIFKGVQFGIFHGSAAPLSGRLAADAVDLGRNPLSLMPCQGTGGEVKSKSLASADLGPLVVKGLGNRQLGEQTRDKATGYERSSIASVDLGDGALVIEGIVGKATVTRRPGKIIRSTEGTTIGSVTANGEPQRFPDTGVLEIPGVAKLEQGIVTRTAGGINVIGLRITLLDGNGGVIDLATAKMRIARSGL
jgi:hypothetical protein